VLGFPPDPARPLTELGLDSLVAVRIKSVLEHDFGVTVPASDLLRGLSLAALEEDLCGRLGIDTASGTARAADICRIVRPLTAAARRHRADRADPVLFFCAHPAGGGIDVYRQLAALIGEDLPFYGLDRLQDAPELEERAARYVTMIRVRPLSHHDVRSTDRAARRS
jgi:hypothetical protein